MCLSATGHVTGNEGWGGRGGELLADARFDLQLHLIVALFDANDDDEDDDDDDACNMPLLLIAALVPQAHTLPHTQTYIRRGY